MITRRCGLRYLVSCQIWVRASESARNAEDARETILGLHPDLVLSDIAMPGKDGFELLREIRSLDPSDGSEVPVIAITGLSRPLDQMRAPAAGFDAVLLKPFTPDVLLQVISEVIHRRV
jgi:CheY-like chemotaxis protein